jgi:uncharacterized membrane protein
MRLPSRFPPPESNAYLIVGIAAVLLGIANIYSTIHPSRYDMDHPNAYHHPSYLNGISWIILGLAFLIPAINRRIKK